jgi:arylsulfatase A-like enzyme
MAAPTSASAAGHGHGTGPNLLFIMSDDHAAHALSAYGSRINSTPNLDRIAANGVRFDAAFCTNSICSPSRAAILTGTYNHVNGVTTLDTPLDNRLWTLPRELQAHGYQTALFGKWHLGHGPDHDPAGFDHWRVLPGQGHYHNPVFLERDGRIVERGGYVTDLITDDCIDYLERRDPDRPFALFCHHKAPHRTWEPAARHFALFDDHDIPFPGTFRDDLAGRAEVVQAVRMRMLDLNPILDLKAMIPPGLTLDEEIDWRYQRYIKDYLRVVAAIDENVGRLLDHLEAESLHRDTIVVYTSDQGFFLGDHGWFDKRLMYEESLTMPLLLQFPERLTAGQVCHDIVVNVDFAPTLLDLMRIAIPDEVQGRSFASRLAARGSPDPADEVGAGSKDDWPDAMYYRYWMHNDGAHHCPAHFGVRTRRYKLICYYNDPLDQPGGNGPAGPVEWELFDLDNDPTEVDNVIDNRDYASVVHDLRRRLVALQADVGDTSPVDLG